MLMSEVKYYVGRRSGEWDLIESQIARGREWAIVHHEYNPWGPGRAWQVFVKGRPWAAFLYSENDARVEMADIIRQENAGTLLWQAYGE